MIKPGNEGTGWSQAFDEGERMRENPKEATLCADEQK